MDIYCADVVHGRGLHGTQAVVERGEGPAGVVLRLIPREPFTATLAPDEDLIPALQSREPFESSLLPQMQAQTIESSRERRERRDEECPRIESVREMRVLVPGPILCELVIEFDVLWGWIRREEELGKVLPNVLFQEIDPENELLLRWEDLGFLPGEPDPESEERFSESTPQHHSIQPLFIAALDLMLPEDTSVQGDVEMWEGFRLHGLDDVRVQTRDRPILFRIQVQDSVPGVDGETLDPCDLVRGLNKITDVIEGSLHVVQSHDVPVILDIVHHSESAFHTHREVRGFVDRLHEVEDFRLLVHEGCTKTTALGTVRGATEIDIDPVIGSGGLHESRCLGHDLRVVSAELENGLWSVRLTPRLRIPEVSLEDLRLAEDGVIHDHRCVVCDVRIDSKQESAEVTARDIHHRCELDSEISLRRRRSSSGGGGAGCHWPELGFPPLPFPLPSFCPVGGTASLELWMNEVTEGLSCGEGRGDQVVR